ncbi:MAG: AIR synthase family protein [Candidatus Binatia bacterium]
MPMLPVGKLPITLLKTCITATGAPDARVLIGPRFGEDCAVIDVGEQYLITKTDPVTFTAENVGWYAVHVNANDVATMGARPCWFQTCLLFPPDTEEATVRHVFRQIDLTCRELGIAVTGGHTEVTTAVTRPVVVGDMHGIVAKNRLVSSAGARPGDLVVMTKTAGLEGTSILATEKQRDLQSVFNQSLLQQALQLRHIPGISVVKEALLAAEHGVTAMHDPTEGGIAMGLYELSTASEVGLTLDLDAIPILPATQQLCRFFRINPLGLISSGTLLFTIPRDCWTLLEKELTTHHIQVSVIGTVDPGTEIRAFSGGKYEKFTYSETDEIAKVL